jgi:hypothetical protein
MSGSVATAQPRRFVTPQALVVALVALAMFVSALFVATPKASATDASCIANYICIWNQVNYNGAKYYYACNTVGVFSTPYGNPYRSAKNRCGSKYNVLNTPWGAVCMGPGGDRPSPGYFNSVTILNWGDRC